MKKDEILAALPNLKRADLEQVHAIVTSLLGGHTSGLQTGAPALPAMVFDALSAICGPLGGQWAMIATTKHGKLLIKHASTLEKFFKAHFKGWDDTKVTQMAFLRMMFELIADDLKERGVQPTFGIMVVNLLRVPEVFENAFPGYLANGFGPLLLKNLTPPQMGRN